MKQLITLAILAMIAGCRSSPDDRAINGVYVNRTVTTLQTIYDTLFIQKVETHKGNQFWMEKRSRVVFKKAKDQRYNTTDSSEFLATYDREEHALFTEDPGVVYYYQADNNAILIGESVYQK